MSLTIRSSAATMPRTATTERSRSAISVTRIPLYVYAVSLASLLTAIGILWDISWHRSIGRDKFLSPPHILIYLGAIFGGLFSGIQVLWNTFKGPAELRSSLVRVWGVFYSSLGALFCIWGAIAMLTSAPFDDWWHSAYGLDVRILSPPHTLLGLGMMFLQFGACVSICKYVNIAKANETATNGTMGMAAMSETRSVRLPLALLQFLFVLCASSLLCMMDTLATSFLETRNMRLPIFYEVATLISLLFLPAFGRALRMKWGMTMVALGYFLICGASNWILQLFPAEPRLGPILTHTTYFQPSNFPVLLFIPAAMMDLLSQRLKGNEWSRALLLSLGFVLVLLVVQYPLSGFLLESPGARNWFFGSNSWYYALNPDWPYRYKFRPMDIVSWPDLAKGIFLALIIGTLVGRVSLRWGNWMKKIQR
jgi:hypothetical protein